MVNAARAAVDEGLRTVVVVTRTRETKIDASYVRKLLGDLAEEVIVADDFISPTSRASGLFEKVVENLPPFGGCVHAGSEISIHPNGDVAFCCGHIITDPALAWFTRVGNLTREHLWDVVDRIQRNVLIWYIRFISPPSWSKNLTKKRR